MPLVDTLVGISVVGGFFWIILVGIMEKKPKFAAMVREFLVEKKEKMIKQPIDKIEQVYDSRSMM